MIITLYGPRQGLGTTFSAINLTACISKKYDTILADLNMHSPDIKKYLGINESHSIDNLISLYDAHILNRDTLSNNMITTKKIKARILGGTFFPERAEYIEMEKMENILDVLNDSSEVVICDTHNELNNAATVSALIKADIVMLIINQNPIILEEAEKRLSVLRNLKGMNISKVYGIINAYNDAVQADAISIKEDYKIKLLATIRDVGAEALNSIVNKQPYITDGIFKSREMQKYFAEINNITDFILKGMEEKTA